MRRFTAALVQLRAAWGEPDANVARAARGIDEALARGADLVVLPEGYAAFGDEGVRAAWAFDADDPGACPALAPLLERSRGTEAWLVAGGTPERGAPEAPSDRPASPGRARTYNTCVVVHRGEVVARYRKIHRFDASVPGVPAPESQTTAGGDEPVVVQTPLARLGLSVCYDLRFPELYAALSRAGAEVMLVPSAFTLRTGLAHWETLLRARAIETQTFVVAAAQHGDHGGGRESFGHSMIVDPWGTVIAQRGSGDGLVLATLDPEALTQARARLPVHAHHVLAPGTTATLVAPDEHEPPSRGDGP